MAKQFGGKLENTVQRLLQFAASSSPNKVAATLGDDAITYSQVAAGAARLAHALSHWGVRKGDCVAYWSDISLRAVDLFFATSYLGAIFVPVNPGFSPPEFDAVLDYLQPTFVIVDVTRQDAGAIATRRSGAKLGLLGAVDTHRANTADFNLEEAARRASDQSPEVVVAGSDPNVFFLTSGSTGKPKAVVISHQAHFLRTASSPSYDAVCGGRGAVSMFPLFHMAGWHMILQAFGRRRPIHLTRQASAEALWAIIAKHAPHEMYCIPAVWRRILENGASRDGRCLNFALTGTSLVDLDLIEAIRSKFPNARNGIYYGSTEMGVSLGISHEDIFAHPQSVGIPMPNVEARVVDGELWLKSDTAMDEYYNLAAETQDVLQDGWYRSGDLVTVDSDGFYQIVGRRREIIRSGGESIAPAEVETAIAEMSGIREVAVIGLPDESWGEIVCAVVVVEKGCDAPSIESIRFYLTSRLASFKHPRLLHIKEGQLPRTVATGQIQRGKIKQELLAATANIRATQV
jgi:fatty-acyl-CoA synthase